MRHPPERTLPNYPEGYDPAYAIDVNQVSFCRKGFVAMCGRRPLSRPLPCFSIDRHSICATPSLMAAKSHRTLPNPASAPRTIEDNPVRPPQ